MLKGQVPIGYTINHIDGIKSNNKISNLECITVSDNNKHAFSLGLNKARYQNGTANYFAKFSKSEVLTIREEYETGVTISELSKKYNVVSETIRRLVNRKSYVDI